MEENSNLTAERSLEIITEQIEKSRQAVSKDAGQWLFVSGLITMGMAVVAALLNYFTVYKGGALPGLWGHLLWFVLPLIIWVVMKFINRGRAHVPENLVGTLVRKTWYTIFTFAIVYTIFAAVWNKVIACYYGPEVYSQCSMYVTSFLILLLSVGVSITGHILKKRKLVWFGTLGGLLIFILFKTGIIGRIILGFFPMPTYVKLSMITPCEYIFLFALIGLTIPGWMLKKADPLTPLRGNKDSQASVSGEEMVNGK